MKQKIVIKVCMPCDSCRTKALKVVAKTPGLISVAISGDEKLEVVGDGVDIACLVKCLRRKICYAEILQVEIVQDKKTEEKKPEEPTTKKEAPQSCSGYCSCQYRCQCHPQPMMMVCEDPNVCAVM